MIKDMLYLIEDARNIGAAFLENKFEKVDLILTSPPYFDVKNYENAERQIGHKQSYDEYLNDIALVLQDCYSISKDHTTLWLVMDTIKRKGITYPLPFDIHKKLIDLKSGNTWILRDVIIWNKYKNLPWHAKGRFKNQFEYILYFSKTDDYKYYLDRVREIADYKNWWLTYPERYNSIGKPPSNVWEFSIPIRGWGNGRQNHFCPFPFPLIERILSISSDKNDVIFDPFAGSGSVLAMAQQMNRRAIGFDINRKYKDQFEKEVIIGAKHYWEKRKKELNKIKGEIRLFTETNHKLRKIKVGIKLKEFFQEQIPENDITFIVIDKGNETKEIDFILFSKENESFIDLSARETYVNKLESRYKVNINIMEKNIEELLNINYKENKFFGYLNNKIYNYEKEFSIEQIFLNNKRQDFLFSNIKVKIDRKNISLGELNILKSQLKE
ncbi:site-specific DNA-methyltransferase [bacterium]|nr:site-specific DNA-methyltransferase [bacterium]MBU1635105.1 site-specific DNA-methyltransferase [bacterium]